MVACSHGYSAPDDVIEKLPICQAGEGRHRCAVCAYAEGLKASQGKAFKGPSEACDQGHDSAPLDMLRDLPISQAGPQRHRCVYRAYQEGKNAGNLVGDQGDADVADDAELVHVLGRTDIGATEKTQLVLARRGQGTFRDNVSVHCPRCRVTGISDRRFLIASHVKPWRDCSDPERLDGFNGLLLAPHADKLFDGGWLTFEMAGDVVRSPHLPEGIWDAWGLSAYTEKEKFHDGYAPYLDYHQFNIFKD